MGGVDEAFLARHSAMLSAACTWWVRFAISAWGPSWGKGGPTGIHSMKSP